MLRTTQAEGLEQPAHPGCLGESGGDSQQLQAQRSWHLRLFSHTLKAFWRQSHGITPLHTPTKHSHSKLGFGTAPTASPQPEETSKAPRRGCGLCAREVTSRGGSDGLTLLTAGRASALSEPAPWGSQSAPEAVLQDWPADPSSALELLQQLFLLDPQISIPKWIIHSVHLHQRLMLMPMCRFSLINKPTLQTSWPASVSKHVTGLCIPSLSSNPAHDYIPATRKEIKTCTRKVNYGFRNEITIKQDEPRHRRSCLHVYFLDYNPGAHKQAFLFVCFKSIRSTKPANCRKVCFNCLWVFENDCP